MKNAIVYGFRNKRNANKVVQVRHYADGHYYARQIIQNPNGITNIVGVSSSRQTGWHRWNKKNIIALIEDDYDYRSYGKEWWK